MPGVNIIASETRIAPGTLLLLQRVQQAMLHSSSYELTPLVTDKLLQIGFTAYPSYPLITFEAADWIIALEGMIYNRDVATIRTRLVLIVESLNHSRMDLIISLKRFAEGMDGEYLVSAFDKQRKRLVVFNDVLGRLPTFFHRATSSLIVSREAKFVIPFLRSFGFDPEALMEYLLFGFPFRSNTLVSNVELLPPATVLVYDLCTGLFERKHFCSWTFSEERIREPRERSVKRLRDTLLAVMADRVDRTRDRRTIVSLSGGMDSRGVLGTMIRIGTHPIAVTVDGPERDHAEQVAKAVGVTSWTIPAPCGNRLQELQRVVFLKDGLDCHPSLCDLHSYLAQLSEQFGQESIYYTGILGGEVTRCTHLTGGLRTLDDLVAYLLYGGDRYRYTPKQIGYLLGHNEAFIAQHLRKHLEEFREADIYGKYLRFRHEYDIRYAAEGEDRNRFYFWTVSPYFSYRYFTCAMSIPEPRKDLKLFRDMLLAIDPRLCSVPYYNFGVRLDTSATLYAISLAQRLMRISSIKTFARRALGLNTRLRGIAGGRLAMTQQRLVGLKAATRSYPEMSDAVRTLFDTSRFLEILDRETDVQAVERLLVVCAYIESASRWWSLFRRDARISELR